MTIFEVLQEYANNKDKYVGFKRECDTSEGFMFNKDHTISNTGSGIVVSFEDILCCWCEYTDWVLIEKEIIPEGFHKNAFGDIVKPCICDLWVNVYYNIKSEGIQEVVYQQKDYADNCVKRAAENYIFIKQLHLSQQYSVYYDKIKEK